MPGDCVCDIIYNHNIVEFLPQMVVIWNTSRVKKTQEVSVISKAHTDVDIVRMKVAAFDDTRWAYIPVCISLEISILYIIIPESLIISSRFIV